jgi:hypothetical protein
MNAHAPRLPFSLDPLMAEARRRARQRRVIAALVATAVVAAGAVLSFEFGGLGSSVRQVPASLTVLGVGDNGGRALFHLRCDPAGGNVAQPAKACAAIAAQPSLVTNPKPFFDGGNNGWYFKIDGRLNGRTVHFSGESDWTTQSALIDKLGLADPHGQPLRLEAPRHGFVGVGKTRTFEPGVLRPGDFVTCRIHHSYQGPPLAISVPVHGGGGGGYLGGQAGVLGLRVRADGVVTASCLSRKALPLDKRGRTTLPQGWPPQA